MSQNEQNEMNGAPPAPEMTAEEQTIERLYHQQVRADCINKLAQRTSVAPESLGRFDDKSLVHYFTKSNSPNVTIATTMLGGPLIIAGVTLYNMMPSNSTMTGLSALLVTTGFYMSHRGARRSQSASALTRLITADLDKGVNQALADLRQNNNSAPSAPTL